jgi:hypothetical protein
MTVAQVPPEKSQGRLPFRPLEGQPLITGSFRLRDDLSPIVVPSFKLELGPSQARDPGRA